MVSESTIIEKLEAGWKVERIKREIGGKKERIRALRDQLISQGRIAGIPTKVGSGSIAPAGTRSTGRHPDTWTDTSTFTSIVTLGTLRT